MKGRSTQSLVNTYPGWTNVRTDEQSGGYQFMNAIGRRFDDLRKQAQRIYDNLYLASSIVSDIDVFYSLKLPGSFEFEKEDGDETEFLFTPPTVSGILDGVQITVDIAADNDIESFWYNLPPDRVTWDTVASGEHLIAEGEVVFSPYSSIHPSGELHIPNHVYVTLDGGESYLAIEDQQIIRRGLVQIEGTTREGAHVVEELNFVHDETLRTFHEFKTIDEDGIRVYGVEPSGTNLHVRSARFGEDDYAVNYQLDEVVTGQDMPLFFGLGTTASGINTLDLIKYDIDELELRLNGFTTKQVALQQELLDVEGSGIAPVDMAVEPHSDALWAVDDHKLYRFTSDLPYPDLSQLRGKNYKASSIIVPSSYYNVIYDDVELSYVWQKPTTGFIAHRVWVVKPDGTKFSIEDGVEVTYHIDRTSWIFGEPRKREIRPADIYHLDQRGDYVFSLEVRYTDETTSIDKRVVSVVSKQANAEFYLPVLGVGTDLTGVDFDSEENLWVMDASGVKYRIDRHYDKMLVDFDRKVLYFREQYDQVRVL